MMNQKTTTCNICSKETKSLFTATLLYKYQVQFFQCDSCRFIQTEDPYWLDEAYQETIPDSDVGYVTRNNYYAERTATLINKYYSKTGRYVDYGGGYGMFTRLMRDKGFEFYRQDSHCQNYFALHFDVTNLKDSVKFEMLTAFEVFEHLVDPIVEIEKMLALSDSILFSTNLQPKHELKSTEDWWYFSAANGQHISLFHLDTLHFIAQKFNCQLYTNNETFHLLTRKKFTTNPIKYATRWNGLFDRIFKRNFNVKKSLIQKDFDFVKAMNKTNHTN